METHAPMMSKLYYADIKCCSRFNKKCRAVHTEEKCNKTQRYTKVECTMQRANQQRQENVQTKHWGSSTSPHFIGLHWVPQSSVLTGTAHKIITPLLWTLVYYTPHRPPWAILTVIKD